MYLRTNRQTLCLGALCPINGQLHAPTGFKQANKTAAALKTTGVFIRCKFDKTYPKCIPSEKMFTFDIVCERGVK